MCEGPVPSRRDRKMPDDGWSLVTAGVADAPVLAAIHAQALDGQSTMAPWPAAEIAELLRLDSVCGLKLERAGTAFGFVLIQLAGEEGEILTIAVRPRHRRLGAGRRLVSAALALAAAGGARKVLLEVAEGNLAARALYAAVGFAVIGRRRGYYGRAKASREDALVLAFALSGDRDTSSSCESLA